jgi:PAS domain S-box-containing protein
MKNDRTPTPPPPGAATFSADWQSATGSANVQTIIDALPDYVMLVDSAHTVLMANRAVKDSLGRAPEEIIGGYCPRIVHGRDDAYPGCPLEIACAKGCSAECELADKETGRVMVSGVYETPLFTSTGRRVYLHTARDITEQRTAEKALAKSERSHAALNQLLRLALESISLEEIFGKALDILLALPWARFSPRSIIFLADSATGTLKPVASRGLSAEALAVCATVPSGECVCGLAAKTRQPIFATHDDPCHARHACTPQTPHSHYCAPIVQGDKLLGVLTLFLPAGEPKEQSQLDFVASVANVLAGIVLHRRAEEARVAHERIALTRERMARVGEMASGVAHLVRNPLQGVMNCLDILEESLVKVRITAGDAITEPIAMMHEGLTRISRVTERLLTLTRDVPFCPTATDVLGCLDEVRSMLKAVAERRHVTLVLDAAPGQDAMLDPDRFLEALANVVGNAIDASAEGGTVTVRARLATAPQRHLEVVVIDTGAGMTAEVQARVFDPFFSTKPIGQGSGLGLAITKRIVDEHRGRIMLHSEPGRGTTVTMTFPHEQP